MAAFGAPHHDGFIRFVPLPSGIASHDTFARVFRLLDARQLQLACQRWLVQVAGQVHGTVAIDGKSVRGSRKGDARKPLHRVSAWAADMGLLLGQCQVDGKSNEFTAIPELLSLLHLKGCIVTIDAIGCQKAIAQQLHEHGAGYVLSVKGKQRHMHAVVRKHFEAPAAAPQPGANTYAERSSGHGREELRSYRVSPVPEALQRAPAQWPGLASVVQVTRQRMCWCTASARTGRWRTSCTGAWTWRCARMLRSLTRTRVRTTRRCCGAWHCSCSRKTAR
ncbi:ISAs1 family transposase [Acidovorax sp. JHL-9]|uniref:ISAs1 family transposase n=1 Tax=Acidovorax sp. JHL-9 TaxID=1276756 RepID=UPI00351092A9